MSVIRHDFGTEDRKAARRLRTLLELSVLHEANIRANPLPYLERASERIFQLERVLFEAVEAATSRSAPLASSEMVSISKAEYDRFLACLAVIEEGLARLVSDAEDP
ncbi:hypothetical protein KMZ93_08255 [Bradyrhizobium sediminis]|uniref:Uncharacterized protein n=1 Tax=Bradyrhizobium sediminis TaxID=2840469 RepID=A0A975P3D6_9BRAD|nr:hypothetical protein [Bradyrhizobium sediminis]QWG24859.1 hypothetical protein KMZ93_08255 [Bradyrhizobium sediminis]